MAMFTDQARFTGMSGLDVNQMVVDLMRAHSVRLDRMRQQREVLLWQRDALRGVATDIRAFQQSFLSFTHNQQQNIRSATNFNAITTSILDRLTGEPVRGVSVSAVDGRPVGSRDLRVESVAQGDLFRSATSLNQPIRADFALTDAAVVGGLNFQVNLNGRTVTIDAPTSVTGYWANTSQALAWINSELAWQFGHDSGGASNSLGTAADLGAGTHQNVWVGFGAGGRMEFHTRAGNTLTVSNGTGPHATHLGNLGFDMTGGRTSLSTAFDPATTSMTRFMGAQQFNFEINGTHFAFNGSQLTVNDQVRMNVVNPENLTLQNVMDVVNNSDAGVRMSFNSSSGRVSMEARNSGTAQGRIEFNGSFFERIGMGRHHADRTHAGIQSAPRMYGRNFAIRSNAFDFAALRQNAIDEGSIGIRVRLDDGMFSTIEADAATASAWTSEVDFLTWLNGELYTRFGYATNPANAPADTPPPSESFAAGSVPGATNNRQFVWATIEDGQLSFNARTGHTATITDGSYLNPPAHDLGQPPNAIPNDPGRKLSYWGFENPPNWPNHMRRALNTNFNPDIARVADVYSGDFGFTVNGAQFEFDAAAGTINVTFADGSTDTASVATVQELMNFVNQMDLGVRMSFDSFTGSFHLTSTEEGAQPGDIQITGLTGTVSGTPPVNSGGFFNAIGFGEGQRADAPASRQRIASDAVVYIDGERFVRANNTFEVDGLRITLDPNILNNVSPSNYLDMTVSFERDTEGVMQLIRDFVEEYNNLIRSIRELTETRRPRQEGGGGFFMPLTDEQRRDMSEREIELWEEQARTGILSRDDTLRRLTQDLHREIFRNVPLSGGGTINLVSLGIRTSSDLTRFGELEIDETPLDSLGGLSRIDYFLQNRPDDVTELFTNASNIPAGQGPNPDRAVRLAESGIGARINDILTWQLSYGGGLNGRVGETLGGTTTSENNVMNRRIEQEDRRISEMLRNLQRREQRYFQLFGRLEAAMIQANSQMMFMEQMFWMA